MSLLSVIARPKLMGQIGPPAAEEVSSLDAWLEALSGGEGGRAGRYVSPEVALRISSVWAALRIRSDTVSSLPLKVYGRMDDGGREEQRDSAQWYLLHQRPNPEMTPRSFKAMISTHLNGWGNAFVGKITQADEVTELWPLHPNRVRVKREKGEKVFYVNEGGVQQRYTQKEILHLWVFSYDGLVGISPLTMARDSLSSMLAQEEASTSFWANGALPHIVLMPKAGRELRGEARRALETQWNRAYRGPRKRGKTAVLEEEFEIKELSVSNQDMEFIAQRKFGIQEVARWFRVPASMLEGEKGGSMTYSSVAMDDASFAKHSIRPETRLIEESFNGDEQLFPPPTNMYAEFVFDELLRPDTLTRYQAYALATGGEPWMDYEDIRPLENLDADFEPPEPGTVAGNGQKNGRVPTAALAPIGQSDE